jgi:hypothetical protein
MRMSQALGLMTAPRAATAGRRRELIIRTVPVPISDVWRRWVDEMGVQMEE